MHANIIDVLVVIHVHNILFLYYLNVVNGLTHRQDEMNLQWFPIQNADVYQKTRSLAIFYP